MVPHLSTLTTPPISRDGISGTFTIPSRQPAPVYIPDSQYAYLERIRSYPSPTFQRVSMTMNSLLFLYLRIANANLILFLYDTKTKIRIEEKKRKMKNIYSRNRLLMLMFAVTKHL